MTVSHRSELRNVLGGELKPSWGPEAGVPPTASGTVRSRRWVLGLLLVLRSFHQMQTPVCTKGHTNPYKDVALWKRDRS